MDTMYDQLKVMREPIVAAIGEALFDCFPDRVVLGGAPVNFAVHLRQLFAESVGQVAVVSGVGNDELGERLIAELDCRDVRTDFVQVLPGLESGQVRVTFSPMGEPCYHIAENAAWDFIELSEPLRRLAEGCRLIYFGTLAQRRPQSRATVQAFVKAAKSAVSVLDLNLRRPHIDAATVDASLSLANVVKLNEKELMAVVAMLPSRFDGMEAIDQLVARLLHCYGLQLVALTRGARGTVLYTADRRIEGIASPIVSDSNDADGVGAGDACCAGLAYGMLMNWPLSRTLELANRMGAYVSSQPGGTPMLSDEVLACAHAD
jgi:fructokinase